MNTAQTADIFGYIATGINIVMFFPQVIKVWQTKNTKSISLVSFLLFAIACSLWVLYGLLLKAAPVILANSVILILNSFIVAMKIKYG